MLLSAVVVSLEVCWLVRSPLSLLVEAMIAIASVDSVKCMRVNRSEKRLRKWEFILYSCFAARGSEEIYIDPDFLAAKRGCPIRSRQMSISYEI